MGHGGNRWKGRWNIETQSVSLFGVDIGLDKQFDKWRDMDNDNVVDVFFLLLQLHLKGGHWWNYSLDIQGPHKT